MSLCFVKLFSTQSPILHHMLENCLEKPILENYKENYMTTFRVREIVQKLSFKWILNWVGNGMIGIENYDGQARVMMKRKENDVIGKHEGSKWK